MGSADRRARLLAALFLFGAAAAMCGTAAGQGPFEPPKPPDPSERVVALIRQDQSDCHNGNVNDSDPSLIGGTVWVVRSGGITRVKVAMTAQPNTTYHFFLKCVRILGDIKTEDEGVGFGSFEFQTNSSDNVYAFDMYPEGAPPGNKYQSVQVKY